MSYCRTGALAGGGGARAPISASVSAREKTKTSSMSPAKSLATRPTMACVDVRTEVMGFVVSWETRTPST